MKTTLFFLLTLFCLNIHAQEDWQTFKQQTFTEMSKISGWCAKDKAELMMDLIKENKFQLCVEVGVFAGSSLYPIAKTLKYNGSGMVYGIDAWDPAMTTKGLITSDRDYLWWSKLNYNYHYAQTLDLIIKNKLHPMCSVVRLPSNEAVQLFSDESIDFIHLDGNISEPGALEDVTLYFPKIKEQGYILLNNADGSRFMSALVFLLERTELISTFEASPYLLFRKSKERTAKLSDIIVKPKPNK
jgi:hypothetical protein